MATYGWGTGYGDLNFNHKVSLEFWIRKKSLYYDNNVDACVFVFTFVNKCLCLQIQSPNWQVVWRIGDKNSKLRWTGQEVV